MKTKFKALLLAVLVVTAFSSCDSVDELTEFDADATFKPTLSISLPNDAKTAEVAPTKEIAPVSKTWDTQTEIDLTSNKEISDNINHIEAIKIKSLTYKVINYTGPDDSIASNISATFGDKVISLDDVSTIKEESDAGTVFTISDSATLTAIANQLKTDKKMTISSVGTVSNASSSIYFDIELTIDMTVTIDVI